MFSQKTIESIATLLKVPAANIKTAIDAKEEVEIAEFDAAKLHVFTEDELTLRDTNNKETGKTTQITAGKEIMIKELKLKSGIEFEGKDPDKFVTAFKEKILKEAKIEPAAAVAELNSQIVTLKSSLSKAEQDKAAAEQVANLARFDADILSNLPDRNAAISDQDYLTLTRSRIVPEVVDGKTVYKNPATGEIYKDGKTADVLPLSKALGSIFESNPTWKPVEGQVTKDGRGGQNTKIDTKPAGALPTKYSEAVKAWQAEGKNIQSADFSTHLTKLQTDNKDFEMDLQNVVATGE